MRSKKKKDGYLMKSEVQLLIQNYIRNIQMNDYGSDRGIPQLYAVMEQIDNLPTVDIVKGNEKEALDLVNQQKAEIERLSIESETLVTQLKVAYEQIHKLNMAKSEAIKEFAERLKEKLQWDVEFDNKLVFESDIDNLVKEMTEVDENDRA